MDMNTDVDTDTDMDSDTGTGYGMRDAAYGYFNTWSRLRGREYFTATPTANSLRASFWLTCNKNRPKTGFGKRHLLCLGGFGHGRSEHIVCTPCAIEIVLITQRVQLGSYIFHLRWRVNKLRLTGPSREHAMHNMVKFSRCAC